MDYSELLKKAPKPAETELEFEGATIMAVTPDLGIALQIGSGINVATEEGKALCRNIIAECLVDPETREQAFTADQVADIPVGYQLRFFTAIVALANKAMDVGSAKKALKKTRRSGRSSLNPNGKARQSASTSVQ